MGWRERAPQIEMTGRGVCVPRTENKYHSTIYSGVLGEKNETDIRRKIKGVGSN